MKEIKINFHIHEKLSIFVHGVLLIGISAVAFCPDTIGIDWVLEVLLCNRIMVVWRLVLFLLS